MKEVKLIDIDYKVNRIKMDKQWYIRVGPNCWYAEFDGNFEALCFEDAGVTETRYQELKLMKE